MYAGYGTTSPPLTNNPFISHSGHQASARFPDIATPPQSLQQQYGQQWDNGSMSGGGGYPQQQQQGMYQQQQPQSYPQQQGYGQQPQQQQMSGGYLSPAPQSYSGSTQGQISGQFQPSSSFGHQLAAHVSGSSYGYLQGQQQQQQQQQNSAPYTPAQQQLHNPGYIAQFDPYSSIAQGWDGGNANPNMNNGMANPGGGMAHSYTSASGLSSPSGTGSSGLSYGTSVLGEAHPKDFIRTHKSSIEAWDPTAWKQLLGTFEALMRAWEARKHELTHRIGELMQQMGSMGYGHYLLPQIQQEVGRLQGLSKEAENNFDSVAASTFQMREVFQGYRQSSDLAGKRRVKEATNAALQGLPTWPQPS